MYKNDGLCPSQCSVISHVQLFPTTNPCLSVSLHFVPANESTVDQIHQIAPPWHCHRSDLNYPPGLIIGRVEQDP